MLLWLNWEQTHTTHSTHTHTNTSATSTAPSECEEYSKYIRVVCVYECCLPPTCNVSISTHYCQHLSVCPRLSAIVLIVIIRAEVPTMPSDRVHRVGRLVGLVTPTTTSPPPPACPDILSLLIKSGPSLLRLARLNGLIIRKVLIESTEYSDMFTWATKRPALAAS